MHVVITNTQLYNGGDAAITLGISKILQNSFGPSTQITIFDPNAEGVKKYYPELTVEQMPWHTFITRSRGRRWLLTRLGNWFHRFRFTYCPILLTLPERKTLEIFKNADMILSSGGTYLVENYDMRPRLFDLYIAMFAKKPAILFTQSLGPFRKPENRRALIEICEAAPLILLRDAKSRRNLLEIGVSPNKIRLSADAAFGLAEPVNLLAASKAATEVRRVAISVRCWHHFKTKAADEGMRVYKRSIGRAAEWLVNTHGSEVVFLSTCQGIPEYWAKDSDVAEQIVAELAPKVKRSIHIDHEFHSPTQLLQLLGGFDLVIATRMHMAILGLVAGVPVLPVAYEFKTEELFANELGMADWVLSIESLNETSIVELLPRFLAKLPGLRPNLFSAVERLRESALEVGPMLRALQ
jgi:colanic acid/amylovoran biosynthesis protein